MQQWRSLMDTTKTIAIYGQSGHGQVVRQIAEACGYQNILWIDDNPTIKSMGFEYFKQAHSTVSVALGIGNNMARQRVYEKLKKANIPVATLTHPTAVIASDCSIGEGSIIMPLSVVNTLATIGVGSIINTSAIVEHECHVDVFVHLSPQAALAGGVSVGAFSHVGIGATVIQLLTIGSHSIVAAGSVVIQNIPNHVMVAGVPATIKKELS